MKKSYLFISCEEAKQICDKTQYKEATTWERVKLNIRLLYCDITKTYSKNNTKLTNAIKKADVNCMRTDEIYKLKKQFETELAKHH
ncbi:MAG: hypothetical protein ACPGUH_06160 [Winogradskyella sp.]